MGVSPSFFIILPFSPLFYVKCKVSEAQPMRAGGWETKHSLKTGWGGITASKRGLTSVGREGGKRDVVCRPQAIVL